MACANAEVYWRTYSLTEHLREALESRDVIGQAKGILMARRGCTPDAAFEALRKVSQHRNIKLRDIAEQVVYLGDLEAALTSARQAVRRRTPSVIWSSEVV